MAGRRVTTHSMNEYFHFAHFAPLGICAEAGRRVNADSANRFLTSSAQLCPANATVSLPSSCQRHKQNQPSLPSPFYSVLVSIFVFMALSTVFHSINSPDNSPSSHCSNGLISALLVVASISHFMQVSFSPDIIPSGRLGSKHPLTN